MKNSIFLLVFLFLTVLNNINAQWQPEIRLSYDALQSYITSNWSIAASGNNVHVVWYDDRHGPPPFENNPEIYYIRSSNGGASWGAETRLTNNTASSLYPTIAVNGSLVHVVWGDSRIGNFEIYYKRSTNSGLSWGTDTRLTNNTDAGFHPSVAVDASIVHIVWQDDRDLPPNRNEIYYKRSTDGGATWGPNDTRLTYDSALSIRPKITVNGSYLHVVWEDRRDGNLGEIYFKRSTDGGLNWGQDMRLTNHPSSDFTPAVAVSGSSVYVTWGAIRNASDFCFFFKKSTDSGINWGADTQLTSNSLGSGPSLAASDSSVHIAWYKTLSGNTQVYYKLSTDKGISWGPELQLSTSTFTSQYPSISVSGSMVHVAWEGYRDGNRELYYRRNPTGSPLGINIINSGIPKQFSLLQNYPNPFNPSTTIRFAIPNVGATRRVALTVHDALGREITTLVNEELAPGTYEASWDASNYPSGVYFYKLSANGFTQTRKMVLAK